MRSGNLPWLDEHCLVLPAVQEARKQGSYPVAGAFAFLVLAIGSTSLHAGVPT